MPGRVPVSGVRAAGIAAAGLVLMVVLVAGAGAAALLGGGDVTPSATATAAIPAGMLRLYERAAATCPGLPWTVLAGIGTVESGNGTSVLPGVHSGANWAGAEGPMQFEPATFAVYDRPVPPGGASPPSPYDPADAVYAAARDLCVNGAAGGADLPGAVFAFNHDTRYVAGVLALARAYGQDSAGAAAPGRAGAVAVAWALAQAGILMCGAGRPPESGSTAPGSSRPHTKRRGSPCPGWPRTSSTPGRTCPQGPRCSPETWSSSARPPPRSAMWGSTPASGTARR